MVKCRLKVSIQPVRMWINGYWTARDAGMKYAVLTAKHTGGFCLWDSKVKWKGKEYDYDIASSGYKKDIVAHFMESCRKYKIKPALYYCLWDDHNEPVSTKDEYFRLTRDHITELVTSYKGLVELWIDIPSRLTPDQRNELYSIVKTISRIALSPAITDSLTDQCWQIFLRISPMVSAHCLLYPGMIRFVG